MRTPLYIALLLAALMLALPAASQAARYHDVIADCNEDGDLDGDYSRGDLEKAEENIPSDIDEYTDCRDVIRDALTGGSRRSRTPTSTDPALRTDEGVQAATQADLDAYRDATRERDTKARESAAVDIDGARVTPGAGDDTFKAARTAANELPLPVLLVLGCMALLAVIAALAAAGKLPWTRSVALRIFRR